MIRANKRGEIERDTSSLASQLGSSPVEAARCATEEKGEKSGLEKNTIRRTREREKDPPQWRELLANRNVRQAGSQDASRAVDARARVAVNPPESS